MQARAGHLSKNTYKKEVSRNSESSLFKDSTLTAKDTSNARRIFGPSLPCIQGKWTRGRPEMVRLDYMTLPRELVEVNNYETLAADVMFVSGLPFLVTLSRQKRYVAVQFVPRRTAREQANDLKLVIGLYCRAGFICQTALMDGELKK
jgi:hypothetical protein